jgi:predicted transposase/invertase (TIGR01784 family)
MKIGKMNEERLNPLNDYLFLKYMGEKGDEEQLIDFLNAVLHKTHRDGIVSIDILENRQISAAIITNKTSVLDLRATMDDGTKVNIEVQLRDVSNMDRRSLFYWSREYVDGINKGQEYDELPRVIAINILGAEFLSIDEMHATFHLWEDNNKDYMLTNALELHFIDMVKFRRLKKKDIEHNHLHRWLTFLDKNEKKEIITKVIEMDTAIAKAQEKISFVSQDSEMFREYQMREMATRDYNSSVNKAKQEGEQRGKQKGIAIGKQEGIAIGKQEGIAIGEQNSKIKNVLRLFQKGKSIEEIAELFDLSVDEVNDILKNAGL